MYSFQPLKLYISHDVSKFPCPEFLTCFIAILKDYLYFFLITIFLQEKTLSKKNKSEISITFQFFLIHMNTGVLTWSSWRDVFNHHFFSLLPQIQCTLPWFFIKHSIHGKRGHLFKFSHSIAQTIGDYARLFTAEV